MRDHIAKNIQGKNAFVQEYNVLEKERPTPFCMKDLSIPQWLLALLVSLVVIVFTAFILFTCIVTLKKETHGGACKLNSDCRQDRGLMCNNYRCGCAYSHFWSESYQVCERRRMINRTCTNDSMCDALASLQCQSVPLRYRETLLIRIRWNHVVFLVVVVPNYSANVNLECNGSAPMYVEVSF